MCREEPRIFFNAVAFTLDPRKPEGQRNRLFILRPKQEEALLKVNNCIKIGKDGAIEKSKDEGASEILIKIATLKLLLSPEVIIRIGSRIEELVDKTGDKTTLFAKIDYCINNLPIWWRNFLGWDGKNKVEENGFSGFERNFLHIRNRLNEGTIDGEATSPHFGAGRRSTFMILDEIGRVDANVASQIIANAHDISDCALFNSTHFFGTGHPFAKLLKQDNVEVVRLLWHTNPEKNKGLYKSPETNKIELIDKSYYIKKWPEIFSEMDLSEPFDYTEFSKKYSEPVFVADGGEKKPIILRGVWQDKEEKERTWEDLCKNVWAYPAGASDAYFDSFVNDRIRAEFCGDPRFKGEVVYSIEEGKSVNPIFRPDYGQERFRWWGKLINGRPFQNHNYIIGCDIGFGTGNSNSAAMIADVNTCELIGEYVTAERDPAEFAEDVAAIARWVGGSSEVPYLIWERNGGGGKNFGRRILRQGFYFVYTDTAEDTKTRKRKNRYGWTSTSQTKDDVLYGLKAALKESLKSKRDNKYLIVHSEDLVDELDSYIFYTSGDADASELVDLNSGARKRHGDRVIGCALIVLALQYQPEADLKRRKKINPNSFAARKEKFDADELEKKRKYRRYRF